MGNEKRIKPRILSHARTARHAEEDRSQRSGNLSGGNAEYSYPGRGESCIRPKKKIARIRTRNINMDVPDIQGRNKDRLDKRE